MSLMPPSDDTQVVPDSLLTAQEYLERRQRAAIADSSLPPLSSDIGDVITASLLASLSDEQQEKLTGLQVAIGALSRKHINAYIEPMNPGIGYIITFEYGLFSLLLALNKLLMLRANLPYPLFTPIIDTETAFRRASETMGWFINEEQEFPRFTVAPVRMTMAATLTQAQMCFVIGHELGHAMAGHFTEDPPSTDHRRHNQEFEADERGVEMVLAAFRSRASIFDSEKRGLSKCAIDLFFTYLGYYEAYAWGGTPPESHTHPRALARRDAYRKRYKDYASSDLNKALSEQGERLFEYFSKRTCEGLAPLSKPVRSICCLFADSPICRDKSARAPVDGRGKAKRAHGT